MKIAIVVDHLEAQGGVERWLEAMLEIWPEATVFAPFVAKESLPKWSKVNLKLSFLQSLVNLGISKKLLAPLLPLVFASFKLSDFEVILSSHAWFATSIIIPKRAVHICYCHTPPRLLWGYPTDSKFLQNTMLKTVIAPVVSWLRCNDYLAAQRVTRFVTNSENVARRIKKFYRREAVVVPCAYDVIKMQNAKCKMQNWGTNYLLVVSRLVAYKNVDIAIEACNQLHLPLVVVGEGPEMDKLKRLAGSTVKLLGKVDDATLTALYQNCKAVIFPVEEDFGNVPIEAMQAGKPVIALGRGGVLETVIPGKTGEFFSEPTVGSLREVLEKFQPNCYPAAVCRKRGAQFSRAKFLQQMREIMERKCSDVLKH